MPESQLTTTQKKKKKSGFSEHFIPTILLLVVIALLIGIPALTIKFNIVGIGEKSRPLLEDIPYVQQILPPKPDPDDPKYMNKQELIERYLSYKQEYEKANQRANDLKSQLDTLTDIQNEYQKFQEDKQQLEQEKAQLQQERELLEQDVNNFHNDIKNEKKTDFRAYYEKLNKETAQRLYEEILKEEKVNKEVKEYVSYYEKMDPENAAEILEAMGSAKIDLIVSIIKAMNKETAAQILASMDATFAARVTDRLSGEYPINENY